MLFFVNGAVRKCFQISNLDVEFLFREGSKTGINISSSAISTEVPDQVYSVIRYLWLERHTLRRNHSLAALPVARTHNF